MGREGGIARLEDCFAEGLTAYRHPLEEGLGEGLCCIVAHLPAGRHHAAHAHLDKFSRESRSEAVAVAAHAAARQMTTIEEHQVRHRLHQRYLRRRQQQAVGEYDAAAVATVDCALAENAVSVDHKHPVRLRQQSLEYRAGGGVGRCDGQRIAGAFQDAADSRALARGGGERG